MQTNLEINFNQIHIFKKTINIYRYKIVDIIKIQKLLDEDIYISYQLQGEDPFLPEIRLWTLSQTQFSLLSCT